MADEIEIQTIIFEPDALVVAYVMRDDIRVDGAVMMQRTVRLDGAHPDYGDDIEMLHVKALKVLRNALEDWEGSSAYVPTDPDDDDDDDEKGMGE